MNKKTKVFLIGSGIGFGLLGCQLLLSLWISAGSAVCLVFLVASLGTLVWTLIKGRKTWKTSPMSNQWKSIAKTIARLTGLALGTGILFYLSLVTTATFFDILPVHSPIVFITIMLAITILLLVCSYFTWTVDIKNQTTVSSKKWNIWKRRIRRLFGFVFMSVGSFIPFALLTAIIFHFCEPSGRLVRLLETDVLLPLILISWVIPTWMFFMRRSTPLERLQFSLIATAIITTLLLINCP